jgi:aryl-alcohol dehydrogenase-like predicted oxidoreductase
MEYRRFPSTDLDVSVVGFGVWTVATDWWGVTDDDLRRSLLHAAFHEHGITLFDTADTYGDGQGETLLQDVLGNVRDRIVIATKFGYDLSDRSGRAGHRERRQNWSGEFIMQACEDSLRRLGTDRIDLYQLHNPRIDAITSDEVRRTLEQLRDQGKVRYIGVALGPALNERQIDEGCAASEHGYHSVQIIYNLLEQQLGPANFAAAATQNSGILVRVPHSSGLLEGNLTPHTVFPPYDHRRHRPREWLIDGLKKVDQLEWLTSDGRRTLGQAAIQFVLAQQNVVSVLPNIYNDTQLAEFADTPGAAPLQEEDLARIAALYREDFGLYSSQH